MGWLAKTEEGREGVVGFTSMCMCVCVFSELATILDVSFDVLQEICDFLGNSRKLSNSCHHFWVLLCLREAKLPFGFKRFALLNNTSINTNNNNNNTTQALTLTFGWTTLREYCKDCEEENLKNKVQHLLLGCWGGYHT